MYATQVAYPHLWDRPCWWNQRDWVQVAMVRTDINTWLYSRDQTFKEFLSLCLCPVSIVTSLSLPIIPFVFLSYFCSSSLFVLFLFLFSVFLLLSSHVPISSSQFLCSSLIFSLSVIPALSIFPSGDTTAAEVGSEGLTLDDATEGNIHYRTLLCITVSMTGISCITPICNCREFHHNVIVIISLLRIDLFSFI